MDCSVLFINMGTNDLFVFDQDSVLIEWELVGPVENTECRLETRVEGGDDIIGEYSMCTLVNHNITAFIPIERKLKIFTILTFT